MIQQVDNIAHITAELSLHFFEEPGTLIPQNGTMAMFANIVTVMS